MSLMTATLTGPIIAGSIIAVTLVFFLYCFFFRTQSSISYSAPDVAAASADSSARASKRSSKRTSSNSSSTDPSSTSAASTPAMLNIERGGLSPLHETDEEEDVEFDSKDMKLNPEVEEEEVEIKTPNLRVYIPTDRPHNMPCVTVEPKIITCSHPIHFCPRHGAVSTARHGRHHHHPHPHQPYSATHAAKTPTITAASPASAPAALSCTAASSKPSPSTEKDEFAIEIAASCTNKDAKKMETNLASPTQIVTSPSLSTCSTLSPSSARSNCSSTSSTNSGSSTYNYSAVTAKLTEGSRIDKLRMHLLRRSQVELNKVGVDCEEKKQREEEKKVVEKLSETLYMYGIEWSVEEKLAKKREEMRREVEQLIHAHCDKLKMEFEKQQQVKQQQGRNVPETKNVMHLEEVRRDLVDMEKEP